VFDVPPRYLKDASGKGQAREEQWGLLQALQTEFKAMQAQMEASLARARGRYEEAEEALDFYQDMDGHKLLQEEHGAVLGRLEQAQAEVRACEACVRAWRALSGCGGDTCPPLYHMRACRYV
jgi:prefoldin subunit 5